MSNRKLADTDYAAKLKASHLAQIDALTREGLSENVRFRLFATAAEFTPAMTHAAEFMVLRKSTASSAAWTIGDAALSLFAYLPTCGCPVQEQCRYGRFKGTLIPIDVPRTWNPSVAILQEFARIQQEARLGQPRTA
jgi:hypothetical protein